MHLIKRFWVWETVNTRKDHFYPWLCFYWGKYFVPHLEESITF